MYQFSHVEILVDEKPFSSIALASSPEPYELLFVDEARQGSPKRRKTDPAATSTSTSTPIVELALATPTTTESTKDSQDLNLEVQTLKSELLKLQESKSALSTALTAEQTTSKARKNTIADYLFKLQKQKELEQILRDDLKSDKEESQVQIENLKERGGRLQKLVDKLHKDLAELTEKLDSEGLKVKRLESSLEASSAEVNKLRSESSSFPFEIKRKDAYIQNQHRQSDLQEGKIRSLGRENDELRAQLDAERRKYSGREMEYSAKLLDNHTRLHAQEKRHTSKIHELIERIKELEEAIRVEEDEKRNQKAAATVTLLQQMAAQHQNGTNSEAYMKLLKANELLEKEKAVLANQVQDLTFQSTKAQESDALIEEVERLRNAHERKDAELRTLQSRLEDEERRAEDLQEMAEIGRTMREKYGGDEDGWEIATQLAQ